MRVGAAFMDWIHNTYILIGAFVLILIIAFIYLRYWRSNRRYNSIFKNVVGIGIFLALALTSTEVSKTVLFKFEPIPLESETSVRYSGVAQYKETEQRWYISDEIAIINIDILVAALQMADYTFPVNPTTNTDLGTLSKQKRIAELLHKVGWQTLPIRDGILRFGRTRTIEMKSTFGSGQKIIIPTLYETLISNEHWKIILVPDLASSISLNAPSSLIAETFPSAASTTKTTVAEVIETVVPLNKSQDQIVIEARSVVARTSKTITESTPWIWTMRGVGALASFGGGMAFTWVLGKWKQKRMTARPPIIPVTEEVEKLQQLQSK